VDDERNYDERGLVFEPAPVQGEETAQALVNKGLTLAELGRREDAIAVYRTGSPSMTTSSRAIATNPPPRYASRPPRRWSTKVSRSLRSGAIRTAE
jgi:hypothetical protein